MGQYLPQPVLYNWPYDSATSYVPSYGYNSSLTCKNKKKKENEKNERRMVTIIQKHKQSYEIQCYKMFRDRFMIQHHQNSQDFTHANLSIEISYVRNNINFTIKIQK